MYKKIFILFSSQEKTNQDHNEINILHSVKLKKISKSDNAKYWLRMGSVSHLKHCWQNINWYKHFEKPFRAYKIEFHISYGSKNSTPSFIPRNTLLCVYQETKIRFVHSNAVHNSKNQNNLNIHQLKTIWINILWYRHIME